MNLSIRILRARKNKRFSQKVVAKLIGVSRSALAQWESSVCNPSLKNLLELSKTLEVSFEWLATGKGNPNQEFLSTNDDREAKIEYEILKQLKLLNYMKKLSILNILKFMM